METPCVALCETLVCLLDKYSTEIFNGLGAAALILLTGFIWWLLFRR